MGSAADTSASVNGRTRTVTIRWSLLRNLFLLIVLLSGSILVTTVFTGHRVRESISRSLIERALDRTTSEIDGFFRPVKHGLLLTRELVQSEAIDLDDPGSVNALFISLIEQLPQVASVKAASEVGEGILFTRMGDRWKQGRIRPKEWGYRPRFSEWKDARTMVREWTPDEPALGQELDPRETPWYVAAHEAARRYEPGAELPSEVYWSPPYLMRVHGEPGITAMVHLEGRNGRRVVAAFDVLLRELSSFTQQLEVSPHGFAFLLDDAGNAVGLPRHHRFDDPRARSEALLKPVDQIGVPALADGYRAYQSLGADPPPIFSFASEGETYWAGSQAVALGPNRSLAVVVAVPERDLLGMIEQQRLVLAGISLVAFAIAVAMAIFFARHYSRPLIQLAGISRRIARLDLEAAEPVDSGLREVDQLAHTQERMRTALDSFSRYVPIDVVRELMKRGEAANIGGARRTITVLFTDIQGFTTIAEALAPEALTAHMAEYFEAMLGTVQSDAYGEVTQLAGDGFVAFWGAPIPSEDHAAHAIESVLRCRERLAVLNAQWSARGLPALPTRFGLATGPVVVGNVGSPARLVYTAVGDTINLASRLEGLNRFYGTWVLVSEDVRRAAGDSFAWRQVDRVRAKGKREPIELYELLGRSGEVAQSVLEFSGRYEEALQLYRQRRFQDASSALERLAEESPDDLSVTRLLELTREFRNRSPGTDWDAVTVFQEK